MQNCPTYFERFQTRAAYEGDGRLLEWYGAKYPGLRAQWEARRRQFEIADKLTIT